MSWGRRSLRHTLRFPQPQRQRKCDTAQKSGGIGQGGPGRERNYRFLAFGTALAFGALLLFKMLEALQATGVTCASYLAGDAGDCGVSKLSTLAGWIREAGPGKQPLIP